MGTSRAKQVVAKANKKQIYKKVLDAISNFYVVIYEDIATSLVFL